MIDKLSRRHWLQLVGMQAVAFDLCGPAARGADASGLEPLNRFPRMVHEYYVKRVRAAERAGQEARARLKTKADAEAHVRQVRARIKKSFGPFPKKTPLKPRVTGTLERDGYNIEKVIFESRPGFLVTANFYVPKGRKLPVPGVVGTCGHSNNGKAAQAYQAFSQGLARQGYAVLIYDPIGQGERLQYAHVEGKQRPGIGVGEHMLAGNQQFLVDEFFGAWRAWDGVRALDYLLTRPEVDKNQIGVTGNSGGGTMTTWLCGVEQRWSMAAPSCFVTTFRRNMENELTADTEQCPPRSLALHLDHADFLAALAPKPIIVLAKERDYFDARGAEEAHARLKHLYRLLGVEDRAGLFIGPTEHGYSQENREAMYRWFNDVTGVSKAKTEPEITYEKDETLWCTPKGQVADLKSRTVFSFTHERSRELATERGQVAAAELKKRVAGSLRLPDRSGAPDYRILRAMNNRKYPMRFATPYAVETEPGVFALVYRVTKDRHQSRPPKSKAPVLLYVAHQSSDAELRGEPLVAELIKAAPGSVLYTCDVRGVGESRPDTCSVSTGYGRNDYFYASHGLMLDAPYVGQKTFDVLRVLDWLGSFGQREVHLVGVGWGSLPAAFAALLHDSVGRVTLKNALTSYADVAEAETYGWPLSAFVPGVLKQFDLPDCYRALKAKKLRQLEPRGAAGV